MGSLKSVSTSLELKSCTDQDTEDPEHVSLVPEHVHHGHAQNGSRSRSSHKAETATGTSAASISISKEIGHIHDHDDHETPVQPYPSTIPTSALKDGNTTVATNNNSINNNYKNNNHNQLSLRSVQPVNVQVQDLRITADLKPAHGVGTFLTLPWMNGKNSKKIETRTILEGVSADMPSGELMAIIGGSGSGKVS